MAAKGSSGGQSIEAIREREQVRRDARKARRNAPPPPKKAVRITGTGTLVLEIRGRSEPDLQRAYRALDLLIPYFPKYKYHEHRQRAVMEGRMVLSDLPGELYVDFLRALTRSGWEQGKMEVSS